MIDITPTTDSNTQVTVGDNVRLPWLLNAHANPRDVSIRVVGWTTEETYSGDDLTVEQVDVDGARQWRYAVTVELPSRITRVEFRLSDAYNKARDTATLNANSKL